MARTPVAHLDGQALGCALGWVLGPVLGCALGWALALPLASQTDARAWQPAQADAIAQAEQFRDAARRELELAEQSLDAGQATRHRRRAGWMRLQAAVAYRGVDADEAIVEVLRGLDEEVADLDPPLATQSAVLLAEAWLELDDVGRAQAAAARARGLAADDLAVDFGAVLGYVETWALKRRGDLEGAWRALEEFEPLARAAGQPDLATELRVELLEREGRLDEAETLLDAASNAEATPDFALFRAEFDTRAGRTEAAAAGFEALLAAPLSAAQRVRALVGRATLRHRLADAAAALADLQAAVDLAQEAGLRRQRIGALQSLQLAEYEIGELGAARATAEQLLAEPLQQVEQANVALTDAMVAQALGDPDGAVRRGERSLLAARAAESPSAVQQAALFLGQLALDRGDLDAAEQMLHSAVAAGAAAGQPQEVAYDSVFLADLERRRGELAAARKRVTAAAAVLSTTQLPRRHLDVHLLLARLDLADGDLRGVRERLDAADRLLDMPQLRELTVHSAALIRARYAALAELTQDWVLAQLASEPPLSPTGRASIVADGWARTTAWKARSVVEGRAEVRAAIQGGFPGDGQSARSIVAGCDDLRAMAPSGGVLLDYAVGSEQVLVYHASAGGIDVQVLGPRARIEPLLQRHGNALARRGGAVDLATFAAGGRSLYAMLLESALPPGCTRAVIVPAETMAGVPFETLVSRVAHEPPRDFGDLRFALEDLDVSYVPSLALQILDRRRPPRAASGAASGKVLVVAGPDYTGRDLPPLSGAAAEARAIRAEFPTAELLVGADARRSALPADLGPYRILHFAAHGLVDTFDPRRSCIALSGGDDLTFADVGDWQLDADLAVLSACSTARGRVFRGDGVQSLAAAFLRAGARAVVASQWEVGDADTERTMRLLYQGLASGLSPRTALLAARRTMLRQTSATSPVARGRTPDGAAPTGMPDRGHPFHWAPFVILGDAR